MATHATSTRVDTVPLELVPAVTLALEPGQFILVENRPAKPLELFARVHYYSSATAKVTLGVDVPEGWQVIAPEPLEFTGAGDQLVRFVVTPPARVAAGNYALKAYAKRGEEMFRTSVEPLPSLPTRLWSELAVAAVRAFDVTLPEGLHVGYVAAENDPIPDALRRLGVEVKLLDPVALAFSDLRRFDAIAIGIRAYELRDDLARANKRLLDYARAGGTLIVQYQRENVWSKLKPAPFPASIGNPTVRITDENSPVRFLLRDHPVLSFPNKISQEDFRGWFQERGLYFWSQWDQRYQPVLAMRDPGEQEVTGGLLYARYGKGVYIYTGLAFFRQLPEGVPGAYRLFVNLLNQSKAR
jgi:NPCBM-associated, NEW3 domain of alpha-galactosidase